MDANSTRKPTLPPGDRWSTRLQSAGRRVGVFGTGAAVFVAAMWLTYQFVEPAPPDRLTLGTGSEDGAYHRFALELAERFAEEDIELVPVPSAGSVENLARLRSGDLDMAFVQSGIARDGPLDDIEGLASVYDEPVWLFASGGDRIARLDRMAGLTVAIGASGSGTEAVASRLLGDSGLLPGRGPTVPGRSAVEPRSLGTGAAADALRAGEIDAAWFISAAEAPAIEALLLDDAIHLADLERAPALARRYTWLRALTLPAGTIDLARDLPVEDIRLVGVAATLLARADVHPALAELMMQAANDVFDRDTLFSSASRFPSPDFLDAPLAPEAERYFRYGTPFLQRYLPFWAANLIDRLKLLALPFLALLLPLSRMLPPAYRWSVRKKVFRWYDEVQLADRSSRVDDSEENLAACLATLHRVEREASGIDVPLGYAHELYALRMHLDLIEQQVERRLSAARTRYAGSPSDPAR